MLMLRLMRRTLFLLSYLLSGCTAPPSAAIQSFGHDAGKEWSKTVELKRQSDLHHYADVTINGRVVRFVVDTGATTIALTGDDARALGFSWHADEIIPVGRSADNSIVEGKRVALKHVTLGHLEGWDMRAVILPDMEGPSLLGQNFMGRASSIEIRGDAMILR